MHRTDVVVALASVFVAAPTVWWASVTHRSSTPQSSEGQQLFIPTLEMASAVRAAAAKLITNSTRRRRISAMALFLPIIYHLTFSSDPYIPIFVRSISNALTFCTGSFMEDCAHTQKHLTHSSSENPQLRTSASVHIQCPTAAPRNRCSVAAHRTCTCAYTPVAIRAAYAHRVSLSPHHSTALRSSYCMCINTVIRSTCRIRRLRSSRCSENDKKSPCPHDFVHFQCVKVQVSIAFRPELRCFQCQHDLICSAYIVREPVCVKRIEFIV